MFDNLIARAIVPVTIAVTGFVIFGCLLLYSFIKADMTAEALRNLNSCADTVVKSTHYAMMEDDSRSLQNIVANIGTREDVELIHIYDQNGELRYSGEDKTQPATGEPDPHLAMFTRLISQNDTNDHHSVDHANGHISVALPILNEPKCSTAACHFHNENQAILGHLAICISSTHLENTLALLKNRMTVFSLMVLFLTVGGVTALLRMNLFLPILRLAHITEKAVQGTRAHELPKSRKKVGTLDENIYRLVEQRDKAREDCRNKPSPGGDIDARES